MSIGTSTNSWSISGTPQAPDFRKNEGHWIESAELPVGEPGSNDAKPPWVALAVNHLSFEENRATPLPNAQLVSGLEAAIVGHYRRNPQHSIRPDDLNEAIRPVPPFHRSPHTRKC